MTIFKRLFYEISETFREHSRLLEGRLPILVELFHKAMYTDADLLLNLCRYSH